MGKGKEGSVEKGVLEVKVEVEIKNLQKWECSKRSTRGKSRSRN